MEQVRSHRNKAVVEAARLHRARVRKESGETLLEGPSLVEDALTAGADIRALFALKDDSRARELAESNQIKLLLVDERALQRIAGTETPRGPVAIAKVPPEALDTDENLLVSWGVSDPGNVGTLIRTAAAFGWNYGYTTGSADPWSPKTLRSGAGGQFQTNVCRLSGLEDLGSWTLVGTVPRGGVPPEAVPGVRLAILIGSEASGLPEEVLAVCDHLVTIRTPGDTESLNAAVAAGILVHELSKRSGDEGGTV